LEIREIQKKLIQVFAPCLAIALWLGGMLPAIAADRPESLDPVSAPIVSPRANLSASDISAEKVSQFVQAYLQVLRLIDRREGELQAAETESESLRIQQEIEAEAYGAIAAAGLTEQEYLQLLGLANTDAEFGERIAAQLLESD
jgi:hypothetical protein